MADKHDQWADSFSAEPRGWRFSLLADEQNVGRRLMWRLGSWGVAAVGAVSVAVLAGQSDFQVRRDQFAASDAVARQAQQLQQLTREAQAENRRLSSAIDTLNGDRDRLYTRVTSVEQGLESVTGSIVKGQALASPLVQAVAPVAPASMDLPGMPTAPTIGPVAWTAPADIAPNPTAPAAPEPAATATQPDARPEAAVVTSSVEAAPATVPAEPVLAKAPEPPVAPLQLAVIPPAPAAAATPVPRTEFGVDIGGANSIDGLRAIWRGMSKSPSLTGLRPIMVVRERGNGLGMQLRLVAGPLTDAAAAAKICAVLTEGNRPCETSVFDGQRLALKSEPAAREPAAAEPAPKPQRPAKQKRAAPPPQPAPKPEQRSEQPAAERPVEEAQVQPPPPKPAPSLSNLLGFRRE